jgi:hypothetical protein
MDLYEKACPVSETGFCLMAGATRFELATSDVTGDSGMSDFNHLENLAHQNVSKWVKSWGAFAPQVHPVVL